MTCGSTACNDLEARLTADGHTLDERDCAPCHGVCSYIGPCCNTAAFRL
jgi:hypothetical protein